MGEIVLVEANSAMLSDTYARNQRYLYGNRTEEARKQSGYLTMQYSLETLRQVIRFEAVIVAKIDGKPVGHYYPMPDYFRSIISEFSPRLEIYDRVSYKDRPVSSYRFFEIVQILVEGEFQRKGVARRLVQHAIERTKGEYELLLVQIADGNARSVNFHTSVGFRPIAQYRSAEKLLHVLAIDLRVSAKL